MDKKNLVYYYKTIEITSTGLVIAKVRTTDGRTTGLKFFNPIIPTTARIEKMAKKAHTWANEHINMCARQECNMRGVNSIGRS